MEGGDDAWITVGEASALLGITMLRTWRFTQGERARIRKKRAGRRVLLLRADVEALLQDRAQKQTQAPEEEERKPPPSPPPLSPLLPPLPLDQPDPLTGELLTLAEASKLSGIDPNALRALVHRGRLRAKKVGVQWLTTAAALEEYLTSRRQGFRTDMRNKPEDEH